MKPIFSRALLALAVLTAPIFVTAQTETDSNVPPDDASSEGREIPLLNAEQLDELLGPIALYPDALIALILPASTMPTDLVLASRYLGAGGDTAKVDEQPWDESVRALSHYPDVVKWLDDKLSWSIMVGDAFTAQPVDVMQSIQRLRAKARAAGTLADSDEQKVVEEEGNIRIVPAQPEVIYVPYYDPKVVYVAPSSSWGWGWNTQVITYRWCYPTGVWLSYDCDWYNRRIWVVNAHWRHHWYHDHYWRKPYPYRRHHHYNNHDYGYGWTPRHGHGGRYRDRDRDHRHDGRRRDSDRVVRDDRRDSPRQPRVDDGRTGRWIDRTRTDLNRDRTPDRRDVVTNPRPPRGDGRDSGSRPNIRDRSPDRPDRRPETPPTVVTRPSAPRVTPPTNPPRVSTPRPNPVARDTEASRPSKPPTGRWIDRANPGSSTPPRVRSAPTQTATPRMTPAPRSAPTPRVAPAPSSGSERSSQVVRVPVPGGSRKVVVNSAPSGERRDNGGARHSRGNDGGSERRAERRKSNDG